MQRTVFLGGVDVVGRAVVVDPDGKAETLAQWSREVDVAPPQQLLALLDDESVA